MKLPDRLARKIVRHVRENPMVIILAIQETIEFAEEYKKENDEMFYKLFDTNRLAALLKKYKKWLNYKCQIDNDKMVELFLGSKFPGDKEGQRFLLIRQFILSL